MINLEDIRAYCLQKNGVTEGFPFDNETLVFKVLQKIFLLTNIINVELSINLKCNPEFAKEEFDSSKWETVDVPGNIRNFDSASRGVLWLRRSFDLIETNFPNTQALNLGRVYDRDEVYINGILIGIN